MRNFLSLFSKHPSALFFTALLTWLSGFGQTFFLGLLGPELKNYHNLSAAQLGATYSLATLGAAFLLPFLGRLIDKQPPSRSAFLFCWVVGIGHLLLLVPIGGIFIVFIGYLLIRLCGQSGLPVLSSTYVSKKFGRLRGKSLAFGGLGISLSEATLPLGLAILLSTWPYKVVSQIYSAALLMIGAAIFLFFRENNNFKVLYPEKHGSAVDFGDSNSGLLPHVLKWRVAGLFCCGAFLPFLVTGIFFHQDLVSNLNGWSRQNWAASFIFYGIFQLTSTLVTGSLVDRYSARKLLPYMTIPVQFALGLLVLDFHLGPQLEAALFFSLTGMSAAFLSTTQSALMAEIFPLPLLGRIKGLYSSVMVCSTAAAPIVFALLLREITDRSFYLLLLGLAFGVFLGHIILAHRFNLKRKSTGATEKN